MSEGLEALFNEDVTETPEAEKQPDATKTDGQPRDEGGRFASQQPVEAVPAPVAPEPAPVEQPAPVAVPEPVKQEPGHIPITALLDEREKRQRLERELSDLRSRQQPEPPPTFQTPEEIATYVQREAANAAWSAKVDFSESSAREKHGDATVEAAIQWGLQKCEQEKAALGFSPFAVEQMRQRHPIDWVVRQQKRDAFLNEVGDDVEAYKAKLLAASQPAAPDNPAPPAPAAASPQPAAPKPAPPRPSLASAPTAGGIQVVPAVAPFDAVFNR